MHSRLCPPLGVLYEVIAKSVNIVNTRETDISVQDFTDDLNTVLRSV